MSYKDANGIRSIEQNNRILMESANIAKKIAWFWFKSFPRCAHMALRTTWEKVKQEHVSFARVPTVQNQDHFGNVHCEQHFDWRSWNTGKEEGLSGCANPLCSMTRRNRAPLWVGTMACLHLQKQFATCQQLLVEDPFGCSFWLRDAVRKNKTISDGGITVDFWIIKVHTSNWSSNSWRSSNSWGSSELRSSNSWGSSSSFGLLKSILSFEMIILENPPNI